jgi:hypothetical protein
MPKVSILSCWYPWIRLYRIHFLIERDHTKAAYITVKTEGKECSLSQELNMSVTSDFIRSLWFRHYSSKWKETQCICLTISRKFVFMPYSLMSLISKSQQQTFFQERHLSKLNTFLVSRKVISIIVSLLKMRKFFSRNFPLPLPKKLSKI